MEYIDESYVGVFVDNAQANAYSFNPDYAEFQEEIQGRWDQGLDIIDIEYINETWIGVFGDAYLAGSSYDLSADFVEFAEDTQEQWDEVHNWGLVNIEYADGNWVSVFQQHRGRTAVMVATDPVK